MILGITGGTGCGKTTLLSLIRQRGGLVLDCDEIYHNLLKSDKAMLEAIQDRFPEAFVTGQLNRKQLGVLVYADPAALAVTAPLEERVARLMARDGIPESYARSRIAAQHDEVWFRQHCDHVLENSGTMWEFHEKCVAFLDAQGIM